MVLRSTGTSGEASESSGAVSATIRMAVATPATIGILAGAVRVGLTSCQLAALAVAVVGTGVAVSYLVGRWGADLPADREE